MITERTKLKEKSLRSIEYDRILELLSEKCVFEENKRWALGLRPSPDYDTVKDDLTKTDTLATFLIQYSEPKLDSARGAVDAVMRAHKGATLSCAELLAARRMLRNFDRIKKWYFRHERTSDILDWQVENITENNAAERMITEAVLNEDELADSASDELFSIRKRIRQAESRVRDRLDSMIRSPAYRKYLQEPVVTIRQNKFVVPVKAEFRSEISGVIHDVSSSGSTFFIEPSGVAELNTRVMQLRNRETEEINRILMELSAMLDRGSERFLASWDRLRDLETYLARAKLGIVMDAVKPYVNRQLRFSLVKARHPLISKDRVVPIDLRLGYDYDTMIVTGPNTGGKTVTLKTAGLMCAMAASGMMIPAGEKSSVCVFDSILVDIGDEQSIRQSLSTFSGHMTNISRILEQATENSLVLMDELGAGTDPAEGAALAQSIIEALRQKGSKVIATTHYGELKIFALETPGVQNASCEFDVETLRPTYRLNVGVPGKSNAFYISSKLGISDEIIRNAEDHLSTEEKNLNKVFSQLEDMKRQLVANQEELERLKVSSSEKVRAANERSEKIIAAAQNQADLITQRAKEAARKVQEDAYRLTDELKKLRKRENRSARQRLREARDIARNQTARLIKSLSDEKEEPEMKYPPLVSVEKGDRVVIASLNQKGVAQGPANSKGIVEVMTGAIKTKVHISDLYRDTSKQPEKKNTRNTTRVIRNEPSRKSNLEVNLLGLTVSDAILEADRFIDYAMMNNLHTIYLIHGKGTGALRGGLHDHLKKHPQVKSYRLGAYGEGDSGVTVVELKN